MNTAEKKTKSKESIESLKQKRNEKNKIYYMNNKEKVINYNKKKVVCELCNATLCKGSLNTHYKSKQCEKKQCIKKKVLEIQNVYDKIELMKSEDLDTLIIKEAIKRAITSAHKKQEQEQPPNSPVN